MADLQRRRGADFEEQFSFMGRIQRLETLSIEQPAQRHPTRFLENCYSFWNSSPHRSRSPSTEDDSSHWLFHSPLRRDSSVASLSTVSATAMHGTPFPMQVSRSPRPEPSSLTGDRNSALVKDLTWHTAIIPAPLRIYIYPGFLRLVFSSRALLSLLS